MRDTTFNIVLMGMGEPLHNYDETMKALRILADEHGFAMSPRRITLSTVGLLPALERLAREPMMPNLAISLHAPTDVQRGELVPLNKKYGVERHHRGVQAVPAEAAQPHHVRVRAARRRERLARRMRAGSRSCWRGVKSKVNLIPLNAAAGIPFERPSDAAIDRFAQILAEHGVDGLGAQEPRPRHPRGVRPADRRRPEAMQVSRASRLATAGSRSCRIP